jgi:hypothetical protein
MPKEIGPNSARHVLLRMDKRSKPARMLKAIRHKLFAHLAEIGISKPNAVQEEIIERATWLRLHIALADSKSANGLDMSDIGQRNYLAWTNSYQKALMRLGIAAEPDADAEPSALAEYIAMKAEVAAERQDVAQ